MSVANIKLHLLFLRFMLEYSCLTHVLIFTLDYTITTSCMMPRACQTGFSLTVPGVTCQRSCWSLALPPSTIDTNLSHRDIDRAPQLRGWLQQGGEGEDHSDGKFL